MAEITKIERTQEIDYNFSDGLSFEPSTIPEYYTTEHIQRAIALLLAQEVVTKEQTALTCTAAGRLLTASLVDQFTAYDAGSVARTDNLPFTLDFGEPRSVVRLYSLGAPYNVQLDKGDNVFGAPLHLPYGVKYEITYATQRVRLYPVRTIAPSVVKWEWWS